MIDFKKYDRLFTFGCSMTRYRWPTWADILSQEITNFHNYGQSGGGNLYISNSIVEANLKHNFTERDLVIVMWSSTTREDRYLKNRWETPGNIYTQGVHSMEWVYKWGDQRFYLMRDLGLIAVTDAYLKQLPCETYMLSMCPLVEQNIQDNMKTVWYDDIMKIYNPVLERIKPDVLNTVYKGTWPQTPIEGYGQTADYHPTPEGHLEYLQKSFPGIPITEKMKDLVEKYQKVVMEVKHLDELNKYWVQGEYRDRL